MAEENQRTRRTKEEIAQAYDDKIAYHEKCIVALKEKKEELFKPKANKKEKLKAVMDKAKKIGMTPEEIAEKLGFSLDEE